MGPRGFSSGQEATAKQDSDEDVDRPTQPESGEAARADKPRKNGGWQEIEARREKAALKASLADVWDEDFDLDEEILAELDHKAEFFTSTGRGRGRRS